MFAVLMRYLHAIITMKLLIVALTCACVCGSEYGLTMQCWMAPVD